MNMFEDRPDDYDYTEDRYTKSAKNIGYAIIGFIILLVIMLW